MKTEKNNLDELFKKSLENFTIEPKASLWRRISFQMFLLKISRFNFTNAPVKWVVIPTTIVVLSLVVIYNWNSSNENTILTEQIEKQTKSAIEPSIKESDDLAEQAYFKEKTLVPASTNDLRQDTEMTKDSEQISAIEMPDQENATSPITTRPDSPEISAAHLEVDKNKTSEVAKLLPSKKEIDFQTKSIQKLSIRNPFLLDPLTIEEKLEYFKESGFDFGKSESKRLIYLDNIEIDQTHQSGRIQSLHSLNSSLTYFLRGPYKPPKRDLQTQIIKNQKRKTSHLILTTYLSPEITQYTRTASSSFEKSFTSGLSLGYTTAKYILQTGIEVSYFYDVGDYIINLGTYDSIGYFQYIKGFIIDPKNPGSIIYDIENIVVRDSVEHQLYHQTQNNYTYLQFPILVGYKAYERGLFSAYLKAGPNISIILNKKEPLPESYNPNATINSVENYTLPRSLTNLQVLLSLGLHLQATEKLGIIAEPVYRHYIGSIYKKSQNDQIKNPFGVGIKAGAFYIF